MSERRPEGSRDIDWAALIETALTAPGGVGNTYNRFYNYSFMNQMLLLMQGVQEPVATYKRWQSMGRQVLKGSKAKAIVRPLVIEKKNEAGALESKKVLFKPVKCLFGVSETEGAELPPVEIADWDLPTALDTLDIKEMPFTALDGNTQGYSYERYYAINPVAVAPTKTMFHEVGHIVLGHTSAEQIPQYATHRGVMEFQAEATAYLSMNELEQLTDDQAYESRGYIQHWLQTDRPPDTAIRQVFSATDTILKAGRLVTEPAL